MTEHLRHRAKRREQRGVAPVATGPLMAGRAVRAQAVVRLGVPDDLAFTWCSAVLGDYQNPGADHLPTEVISGRLHELVSRNDVRADLVDLNAHRTRLEKSPWGGAGLDCRLVEPRIV